MGRSQVRRKLTTVFCADVQSYSRMMAVDETDTLERLRRYRAIMEKLFARHEGRLVNTWGDAVIAEFASVVEAVRCAVEVQDAISAENVDLPVERQMWFRIGINLGDVMEDGDDIYGDGVNLASRMEQLADPGGVMVSESVFQFAHKQLAIGFDRAGAYDVVEGQMPVVGYKVRVGGSNTPGGSAGMSGGTSGDRQRNAAGKAEERPAEGEPETALRQAVARVERFFAWLADQDRGVRRSVAMIGFFFAVNVLFTGLATPWFIFPSLPFALYVVTRWRRRDPS